MRIASLSTHTGHLIFGGSIGNRRVGCSTAHAPITGGTCSKEIGGWCFNEKPVRILHHRWSFPPWATSIR